MSVGKRDRHTGQMTTGHEWNGIEELNTPVPKVVYVFLGLAFAFAVVYWLLMPAWPLGVTFTRGLLGVSQHSLIDADLKEAIAEKKAWTNKISNESFSQIQADPALMHIVLETARRWARLSQFDRQIIALGPQRRRCNGDNPCGC